MALSGRGVGRAFRLVERSRLLSPWRQPSALSPCTRQFSNFRASRAVAITTASSPAAEADARLLRALFDAPETSSTSALLSDRNSRHSVTTPTGLFGSSSLTTPSSFVDVARRTLLRAQLLVSRIVDAPKNGPEEMQKVVRNLDRLSDLLCGVIDCAELVRNAHPDRAWVEAANEAYEYLCGYMNILNTHTGLYEVSGQPSDVVKWFIAHPVFCSSGPRPSSRRQSIASHLLARSSISRLCLLARF
jgi:intermediate peptidase